MVRKITVHAETSTRRLYHVKVAFKGIFQSAVGFSHFLSKGTSITNELIPVIIFRNDTVLLTVLAKLFFTQVFPGLVV